MKGVRLAMLAAAAVCLITGMALQEKQSHDAKCPAKCDKCTNAVKKALQFLAGKQKEDGALPAEVMMMKGKPLSYVGTDKTVSEVMTTAVAGLAFLANGSTPSSGEYKENIRKIQGYLEKKLEAIFNQKSIGAGGGPAYSACLSLLFYTHIHEKEKDEQSKKLIQATIKFICGAIGDEVGSSTWKGGKNGKVIWYVSGVTSLANLCVISLVRAKVSGFEVDEKVLELMKTYYPMIIEKSGSKYEGSFKYDKHNSFPGEPRNGRSITAILALMCLGLEKDDQYKQSYEYARKNYDKTGTHHVPSLQSSLCAFTFHTLGEDDWKKFVEENFEKLLARQRDDGSLEKLWDKSGLLMQPNDTVFGECYATANFALIFQVSLRNVRLYIGKS
jgi:hypothetical protein